MPYDTQQVIAAIEKMREALSLLDRAGAGSTSFAFHLSLAIDAADLSKLARVGGAHEVGSVEPSGSAVGM